jgi:hypothetical protein
MTTAKLRAAAAVVAATMLACCSSSPSPTADLVREPAGRISVDGKYTHLGKLQEVADANKRTRADGTRGYEPGLCRCNVARQGF